MNIDILGRAPLPGGFEWPLDVLAACHHRIERRCGTLRKLVAHLGKNGIDAEARKAAVAVLRCFNTAAKDHHADEEVDLFPALVESMAGSDAVCIRELIDALILDHRALESCWERLRNPLQGIAAGTSGSLLVPAEVEAFITLYERHMVREDTELLPMARRLLSDDALDRMGKAMRERRNFTEVR